MIMFFNRKKKTTSILGKAKPMDEVTLEDMLQYPIWVFALDEEGKEEQDETWLKPVLNTTDVDESLYEAYILLKIEHNNMYFSASLDIDRMELDDVCFWSNDEWKPINGLQDVDYPLKLMSIPSLKGEDNFIFSLSY